MVCICCGVYRLCLKVNVYFLPWRINTAFCISDFVDDKSDSSSDMSEYDWEDSDEETPSRAKNKKPQTADRAGLTLDDYMGLMDRELAQTNIGKSFVKVDEKPGKAKPKVLLSIVSFV